ncbi:fimbrial protein [Enterobacter kobei]|uniref:fimbrial protein n=1 Tax=Enterobacter kobei TaxID=208224 RepID=UPI002002A9A5|nr:fimbrial protein [Enterobacter kobei]MCK7347724.1 fimbrial protein [Enterobacter kobei]
MGKYRYGLHSIMILFFSFIIFVTLSQYCYSKTATATVSVTVTIIGAATCDINNGDDIDVNFGSAIDAEMIDGVSYDLQPVPITLNCDKAPTGSVKFALNADTASFDSKAMKTTNSELGIYLLKKGTVQAPGTWNDIQYNQTVTLQAVLVKKNGTTLSGGKFTATGTVVYQME